MNPKLLTGYLRTFFALALGGFRVLGMDKAASEKPQRGDPPIPIETI
jgi:hypothetical protein